ncbi:MAG: hypothetical protein ACRC33_27130 [Gemmataceae bacterium]
MRAGLLLLFAAGCGPAPPALRPGDEVRPEVAFAPEGAWKAGGRVAVGMLLAVHRPGRPVTYLGDKDGSAGLATMKVRVTFLDGDSPVGEPLEVPFVKDC